MNKYFIFAFVIFSSIANAQTTAIDTSSRIGGELKGMYIGGGLALVGGTTIGLVTNGFDDHPRAKLPFVSGTIAVAPTSLVGLGLGHLFAKKHSNFTEDFHVGMGLAYSSPIFSEFIDGNKNQVGYNIRLLSKQLGPWRYGLSFNKFLEKEYTFEEITSYLGNTRLSWWELDLDLQYVFDVGNKLNFFAFVGTHYNSVHAMGRQLKTEILANYGFGTNVNISNMISLYADARMVVDLDANPENFNFSIGLLYRL